ncbi:MAG TPA: hypothetical protein EYP10_11420, partial [Armatimonadetes bacterium]|nr:hypothetical protein [Armatimonadota bacterium]
MQWVGKHAHLSIISRSVAMAISMLIVAPLAISYIGCAKRKQPPGSPSGVSSTAVKVKGAYRIAVVPKGVAFDFWLAVKAGAEKAAREEGAEVLWKGPADETEIATQKSIIENFITQRVDAIVMAACDERALVPTVE